MTWAYYNERDEFCGRWLRNLIAAGLISPGEVDTRSVVDVRPADMAGFDRCHFFAGIGVWDYALGLAGWPGGRPVWTGSCPCQPFSAAGRRAGLADDRHLWPAWFDLIRQCRPAIVLGEQVEAAVRLGWLDAVFADLEGQGYACGATVLGAHSVGAPHIRQRLWFVADADGGPARTEREQRGGQHGQQPTDGGAARVAAQHHQGYGLRGPPRAVPARNQRASGSGDADRRGDGRRRVGAETTEPRAAGPAGLGRAGGTAQSPGGSRGGRTAASPPRMTPTRAAISA